MPRLRTLRFVDRSRRRADAAAARRLEAAVVAASALGFAAWTMVLLLATVGVYRWTRILTGLIAMIVAGARPA